MEPLDYVFHFLRDGEWHNLNEISAKKPLRKFSTGKVLQILEFLAEYGFIELSPNRTHIVEAKITPLTQEFIHKIRWIERAGA